MKKDAMHIVSGYTLWLYCCKCHGEKWNLRPSNIIREIATEGPKCYGEARRIARKEGWVLHKDGFASCPKCSD